MKEQGVPIKSVLAGSGLHEDELNATKGHVTPDQELAVIRNVVKLSPDPEISFAAGLHGHVEGLGKLGLACMHCETFADAIHVASQYLGLTLSLFQYDLSAHGAYVYATMHELVDISESRPFVTERELISIIRMGSDLISQPFIPKEIHFAYPEPKYASCYQDYFLCPALFDAPKTMMVFDAHYLNCPLPKPDPLMKGIYIKECEERINKYKTQTNIVNLIRQHVELSDGEYFPLEEFSGKIYMSPRTVRRKLKAEGTTYQDVIQAIRQEHAIHLLTDTQTSIEKIAEKTGYSNTANFYHAFKKWTGLTPGGYRKKIKEKDIIASG